MPKTENKKSSFLLILAISIHSKSYLERFYTTIEKIFYPIIAILAQSHILINNNNTFIVCPLNTKERKRKAQLDKICSMFLPEIRPYKTRGMLRNEIKYQLIKLISYRNYIINLRLQLSLLIKGYKGKYIKPVAHRKNLH